MIQKNQIWKLYGTEYLRMTKKLLEETELASLIGDRKSRIAIKPNLVVPSPAQFGATTHPEVVAGIVEYLQTALPRHTSTADTGTSAINTAYLLWTDRNRNGTNWTAPA